MNIESKRLQNKDWKNWGPYLSERQWGTVREDYSEYGEAWDFFPHDHARSRAYRWGEDGIAGISDSQQKLCFAIALWNEQDPILKERLFGLTGNQGNHGEDVKEYYFYLDSTPTHSYMKCLYKYPQAAYPYSDLLAENQKRSRHELEYELLDTGIFDDNRYFDVFVEYAKNTPEDIVIQITAHNRGTETKPLHILPTLWFRNTWSWQEDAAKPSLKVCETNEKFSVIQTKEGENERYLYCDFSGWSKGISPLLFTENETNYQKLFNADNASSYVKDGINNYVVQGDKDAVNSQQIGTKFSPHYVLNLGAGETKVITLRLSDQPDLTDPFGEKCQQILETRKQEADEFYQELTPFDLGKDERNIQRQAFAGMLWTKQYYYYSVEEWLKGDPNNPPPPEARKSGRNHQWKHLDNAEIISMPDKWEYPWYAAWDSAFHALPLAMLDPELLKIS